MSNDAIAVLNELIETSIVRQLGGDPDTSGSVTGALHRGWISLKEAISSRDDKVILDEVERGEDYAKEAYRKALDGNLPPNVQTVVQRQYQGVLAHHDKVNALRQRYA